MGKRVLILALLVVSGALILTSCQARKPKTITWQVWVTPNLTRAFYDEVVQGFEKANPTIKVSLVEANAATSANADDFIKTRLAAGDVPDLWWNVGIIPSLADSGLLWPIPDKDPDLKKVKNLRSTEYKGKMYSFPFKVQPIGLIFYNKKLWAQAGLTDLPKSWAEFEAACEKIKQAGLTPIITGGEWVAGMTFATFTEAEVFHNNTTWNTARWEGTAHFTDPDWIEATTFYRGLVEKGYFNKGALSLGYADLEQQFLSGKAVMYPMGCWFSAAEAAATKDFEVGVFLMPNKSGTPHLMQVENYGDGVIYAESKNPEAAYKLMKFFTMDPVFSAKYLQADGLYSNLDPAITYDMSPLQKAIQDLIPLAVTVSGMYDTKVGSQPAAGVMAELDTVGQKILAGQASDVKATLEPLDAFWDKAPKP
jgi:ABC-type glycerol-3-phosphate transport system substrate-binding protein